MDDLACAFGTPWLHHFDPPIGSGLGCLWCQAEADRLCVAFQADVMAGVCDAEGYTPNERRAQQRKAKR